MSDKINKAVPKEVSFMDFQREISELKSERFALQEKIKELESLIYVPGEWRCPKCDFRLHKRLLCALTGNVDEEKEQVTVLADKGRLAVYPSANNSIVVKVER